MCGIAGIVILRKQCQPIDFQRAMGAMIEFMEHRGPDDRGLAESGDVLLGACRLAIVGLDSRSNQPLKSSDSESTVIFNGEIYNYVELRKQLQELGHRFESSGDTEVVVHSYEQWGAECVQRLNGMFAFAVLDGPQGSVFIARDRFGVKPLYYCATDSYFAFASEPRALINSGLASTAVARQPLLDYLKFGITDYGSDTFFRDIKQLPPGHSCTVKRGSHEIRQWYDIGKRVHSVNLRAPQDRVAQFRATLESSVALRMRSDVPIGILLSGGLDSSSIAALCSRVSAASPTTALTVSFPGSPKDESSYAQQVAENCRMPIRLERADTVNMEFVRRCISDQQEPFISPSIVAQWLIMRASSRAGLKVLLSGQGADEYLAGYEYFDAYAIVGALRARRYASAFRHLLNLRNRRQLTRILREVAFLCLPSPLQAIRWWKPWLRARVRSVATSPYFRDFATCRTLRESLVFHVRHRLPELLRYEDRNSMAFSIETRHPFLDYRLVELALSAPADAIVGDGSRKRLLRSSVEDIVDGRVLGRRDKIGFETPDSWMDSPQFLAEFQSLLRNAPKELQELVEVPRVAKLTRGRKSRGQRKDLWRVYNLLVWWSENLPEG